MTRSRLAVTVASLVAAAGAVAACSSGSAKTKDQTAAAVASVAVAPATAVEQPIARFIRVTGTLTAEEQADVAAETAGRVTSTPVERGTRVQPGSELVRISATETDAQLKEAEANAAQIEARLGISDAPFNVDAVPEVQNAKANYDLAEAEFNRIKSLLDQRVVSQSEYDQRRAQMEATRQQYEAAKNGAAQQFHALQAARARVDLARKALADTVVRAPFGGLVAQRMVSTGDYVTRGMKVAQVVRISPLRVQLTVPEQFVSAVHVGQPVSFEVDAYPGRQFQGEVRYVSPALQADQRSLTVEATVPNENAELKPGFFATALVQQVTKTPAIVIPAQAVQTASGTSRVYVIKGDRAEERIVTAGQTVGSNVEITNGLQAGEQVATKNVGRLTDGTKVSQ